MQWTTDMVYLISQSLGGGDQDEKKNYLGGFYSIY